MKKIISLLLIIGFLAGGAFIGYATQPAQYKINAGDARWHTKLNAGLDALWGNVTSLGTTVSNWVGIQSYQTATYIGTTSFSVVGDLTSKYSAGQLLLLNQGVGGLVANTVVTSSYATPITTVTVTTANVVATLGQAQILNPTSSEVVVASDYGTNQAALIAADVVAAAAGKQLVIGRTYSIASTPANPLTANLKVLPGGTISIANGATLTINGPLDAGLYQIFSCTGTGKVVLGQQSVDRVHPVWWYSGSGSWTIALQEAIDCRPASIPNTVQVTGAINCVTGVTITQDNTTICGPSGHNSAIITFTPTSTATLFKWANGASMVSKVGIRDLKLVGSGTQVKTFLNIVDVDILNLSNVQIYDDSAVANIGLYCQGRDHYRIDKFTVTCQRPIVIGDNPNSTIDLDNSVFKNAYLVCTLASGKNIEIETGVNLSNVYFEPPFSCNKGAYGLYWVDTTSAAISVNIGIRGLRYEQPQADGWAVRINHNLALQNLILDNVYGGGQNGFHLRKVWGEMRSCQHYGITAVTGTPYTAGVAFDLDTLTGDFLMTNFVNVNAQGGTNGLTIGSGALRAYRMNRNANSYGYKTSTIELFTTATDLNGQAARTVQAHNGVQSWSYRGTLVSGTSLILPILAANCLQGRVWVSAHTAMANEFLDCNLVVGAYPLILTPGTTSTANVDVSDTAFKLCLLQGAYMTLKNNLAADANITIRAEWSVSDE